MELWNWTPSLIDKSNSGYEAELFQQNKSVYGIVY